ncbi:PhzF family phenazine biosynthesis protein [Deinococcus planocerae]|uniref:PhzF family phenazine biosynthesis protein n=1 Tax=Deinococcus planocerae TaxID=1737569 RepID=UPI000C7F5C2B|nr:PhzF family phenazine biosynthesis protein [Deinococcus planocerae]
MTVTSAPALYRVLSPPGSEGGRTVAVFSDASDNLQTRATSSGAPLSVFVGAADVAGVSLRVFTPDKEKGTSDSGALAALAFLQPRGVLLDVVDVTMGGEVMPAQLCGGEWLLRQGDVTAREVETDFSSLGVTGKTAWVASAGRPNLVMEVADAAALEGFTPDADAISSLNRETDTTGLILFTMGGPNRADVSFRAFGPLKGFLEDGASSHMFACLVGVLGGTGRLPTTTNMIRGAQRMPGAPSRLTAQFTPAPDGAADVWVGGRAERVQP